MTLLCREEIIQDKIVRKSERDSSSAVDGLRDTTYDSTIGSIFDPDGNKVEGQTFMLKPRAIAWITSAEYYRLPKNITGITTLKTGWTKQGILTLTVGIVDPGYEGPLSTAVINFSKKDFPIRKGNPFFRTAFFNHTITPVHNPVKVSQAKYETLVEDQTTAFSDTFLTMDTLAEELSEKLFALPRWAFKLAILALLAGVFGILISYFVDIHKNVSAKDAKIDALIERIETLENR